MLLYQSRDYKKFSRTPIKIIPAKGDAGKVRMEEYVNRTQATTNHEVIDEMENLKEQIGGADCTFPNDTPTKSAQDPVGKSG